MLALESLTNRRETEAQLCDSRSLNQSYLVLRFYHKTKILELKEQLKPPTEVPNLQDLMSDDLRWSWCDNNRNKAHNKCNAFESSWNHSPSSVHGKNVFCETAPWSKIKKFRGHYSLTDERLTEKEPERSAKWSKTEHLVRGRAELESHHVSLIQDSF